MSDIYQGNLKLILALIWALILRYQIASFAPTESIEDGSPTKSMEVKKKKRKVNAKKLLLDWVNASLPLDGITNFTTDWNDGLRLSGLVNYCKPGLIPDHASLNPDNRLQNVSHAMDLAEKEHGVPKLLSPEDLAVDTPDELSVMTYISGFCRPDSAGQNSLLEWVNIKIPNHPVSNFTTDWVDGTALATLVDAVSEGGFPESDLMKEDDKYKNCQEAMDAAKSLLGIDSNFSPEDFSENTMDQITRSTYITKFRHAKPLENEALASQMKAVGPGVTGDSVEKETSFVVRGPRIPQWEKIMTTIKGPDGSELPVKSQCTSFKATQFNYFPMVPGDYVIDIKLNSQPIPGSPFNVIHVPPTNVIGCAATGNGLKKARVGETADFSVNSKKGGPRELQVNIKSPNGNLESQIKSSSEKNYNVYYTPKESGEHFISIMWDKKNIPSSPFSCIVTDPKQCSVIGLPKACTKQPQTFTVRTDKAGIGELVVEVVGPSGPVDTTNKAVSKNAFNVTYIPRETGPHHISVRYADDSIPGSPFTVNVVAPADASKCIVSNLPEGRLCVGRTYSFDIDATQAGSGEMIALAHGPTVPESCSIKVCGDNLYAVNFTPTEIGPLKVEVTYGGDKLPQCPLKFTSNDPTKVKVNSIESAPYLTNQPIQLVVSAAHAGEGDLLASVRTRACEEPMEMKNQGGKSYLFSYSPREGGSHVINIKFDGTEIPDMPIRVFVDDSNLANKVVVTQPLASKMGAFLVDAPYNYKVITTGAGHEVLKVTSIGSNTGLEPTIMISDESNEQFTVVLTASEPDEYIVNMQWGGKDLPASPFKLLIEGKPQPENVVCVGPLFTVGSCEPVTVEVNAEKAGAGKLSATCRGNGVGEVPVNVVEHEPKQYSLSFSPPMNDIYSLNVLWLMSDVKDSPFMINLIPPDATKCIVVGPEVPIDPTEPILLHVDASEAGNGKIAASVCGDKMGDKDILIEETKSNVFVLSFVPELMDIYTMEVLWGDSFVPGAPFRVNSTAANARKVFVCEPPSASHEASQGIRVCFNTSAGGKGILTANCMGENTGKIPITVRQRSIAKYKYDICFLPTVPDIYVVEVLWNGVDVKGSPFTINLIPVDMNKIKVIGPSMPQGPVGPVELMLQAIGAAKGKVKATCYGNSVGPVEVVIKETSTDVFELCFLPPKPDIFNLSVQYGGQKLKDSPFIINTLPADANLVKVNEPVDFSKQVIYNVDTTKAGSGNLTTTCHGEKHGPVELTTTSKGSGYYDISFTPQADVYMVTMEWDGREVPDSPFQIDLRPPMADRVNVGELHVPDRLGGNDYVWLDLDCMDAGHGQLNAKTRGKVVGKMPVEVNKLVKAKYRMKFLPKEADIYTFAVAYGDQQVTGSPFKINLNPPNGSKVKHTRTVLPELEGGPVVMFFDTTNAGRGILTAYVKNGLTLDVTNKVEQVSFTEHKISFVTNDPDIYDIDVKWSGDPANGSPFKVDTRPLLHAELLKCGKPVFTDINDPVNLFLNTSKAGPGKVTANCTNCDGSKVHVEVVRPTTPSGDYKVYFIPKTHGKYVLSVFFDGEDVKNSPFLLDITPVSESCEQVVLQNIEEAYCIPEEFQLAESINEERQECVSEPILEIGSPFSVTVSLDNKEKSDTVTASARGDNTGPHDVAVTKNDTDNTFYVYFSPTVSDHYSIDIAYNGVPIKYSPYLINYIFPINPSKCRIFGLQNIPPVLQVDEPISFGVDAKEAGKGELSVTADGPSSNDELDVRPSDKGEPGIYNITYVPNVTGKHHISLLWSGDKISCTPLSFEVVDVREIERFPYGKPVSIKITASAKTGNLHAHAIHEESETKSKVKLSKKKNGKLKLAFQPKQPGIYAIHVLSKKTSIPGSPTRIRYLGPSNSKGVLVCDFSGKGFVNHPYIFTVNAEKAGTGELAISVEGPRTISDSDITFAPNEESVDICYNVCYIPQSLGEHQFIITWAGMPIPLGPHKVDITEDKPECMTVLQGEATNMVEVGQPANVIFMNSCTSFDPESISADCEGDKTGKTASDISVQKKENDKMYVVQFTPAVEDDYTFSVKQNDSPINGSPFTIKAIKKDALSPDYDHPDEPQHCDIAVGTLVNVVRRVPELKEPPIVLVNGPYDSCLSTVTTDSYGGLGVQFLPPLTGDYIINVVDKDGSSIQNCPCKITVIGMYPDFTKVFVLGEDLPLFDTPVSFGKPAYFRISTVNASSGTLNLTAKGPGDVTVKMFDNLDGIYGCNLTCSIAGQYLIDILWDDNHIKGSPYMLDFKSDENSDNASSNSDVEKHLSAIKVFVLEEDLSIFDYPVSFGKPVCFRISTADAGPGTLNLRAKGPGKVTVNVIDNQDGAETFTCNLTSNIAGKYLIDILWNDYHIEGSPYILHFKSNEDIVNAGLNLENGSFGTDFLDASKCVLVESFVTGQNTDQEKINYLVSTEGAGTGNLSSSVDQISSMTPLPVTIIPLPDCKYKVEISPEQDKEYLLNIRYDNQHISGSPFKLMFGGDAAEASQCTAEGDGIEACVVDKEATFTVKTVKPNHGALFVSIIGQGKTITPKIKDLGNTKTEVSYIANRIGKYNMSIKWAQDEIPGSPFLVECYNPSDPSRFMIQSPPTEAFQNSLLTFMVKSVSGRPEDGSLVVSSQSPQNTFIQGHVEDVENDESSYKCTLDLHNIGKYFIDTRWSGCHIRNSPFKLKVVSPPMPHNVRAYGPGLENGLIGEEGKITIETEYAGRGTLAVRVLGPKKSFRIKMRHHPDNNRTVLVRYDPNQIGKYKVFITWSEVNIPGSPFKMKFMEQ